MREIKFRAYHKYMQKMLVPVKIHLENGKVTCFETLLDDNVYQVKIDDREYGLHTMQYTGLKDRNGKEIYEGDLLEGEYTRKLPYSKVKATGRGVYRSRGGREYDSFLLGDLNECEVIGNIYENPDLFKINC